MLTFFRAKGHNVLWSYYRTLNIVYEVCSRSPLKFRDQEHGNMPRTKMERKVSRLHSSILALTESLMMSLKGNFCFYLDALRS